MLADRDLRIDDNHARGDYRAYFRGALKPDHIVPPAADGAIYSIHPIGVSLLVAPGFALGGYRGASLTVVLLGAHRGSAVVAVAARAYGSGRSDIWMAGHRHERAVRAARVCGVPGDPGRARRAGRAGLASGTADTRATAVVRGLALGALPWLGTKYAPMALVIGVLLALRAPKDRARLVAIAAPAALLVVAWLAWFAWLWGTPSPTAPYGAAHQMALWHLAAGLPGLFFDQEYGIAAVAPVLAMASVGWWRLWRRDAGGRRLVVETLLPLLTLALTVGAYAMWWGGSAPPGRQLVAALPLLGVPLAALWHDLAEARRASCAAGRPARRGHRHDRHAGRSRERACSSPTIATARRSCWGTWRLATRSAASCRRSPRIARRSTWPLALLLVWAGVVAVLWWIAGRAKRCCRVVRDWPPSCASAIAVLIVGAAVPATRVDARLPGTLARNRPRSTPTTARRGPVAIVFDPWRLAPPAVGAADGAV